MDVGGVKFYSYPGPDTDQLSWQVGAWGLDSAVLSPSSWWPSSSRDRLMPPTPTHQVSRATLGASVTKPHTWAPPRRGLTQETSRWLPLWRSPATAQPSSSSLITGVGEGDKLHPTSVSICPLRHLQRSTHGLLTDGALARLLGGRLSRPQSGSSGGRGPVGRGQQCKAQEHRKHHLWDFQLSTKDHRVTKALVEGCFVPYKMRPFTDRKVTLGPENPETPYSCGHIYLPKNPESTILLNLPCALWVQLGCPCPQGHKEDASQALCSAPISGLCVNSWSFAKT